MTSRWVSALCCARSANSREASAICLPRASSSERTRSMLSGAIMISASHASRARNPRSCLSFALLRLKLTRDIFAPDPTCKVDGRVQEAFPELGKIRTTGKFTTDDMVPENPLPTSARLPNGLSAVEHEIVRACKHARRDPASVTLIAVSKTFDAGAITPVIEAGHRGLGENRAQETKAKKHGVVSAFPGLSVDSIRRAQTTNGKQGPTC